MTEPHVEEDDRENGAGLGVSPPETLPDQINHEGGNPVLDSDAQYGASPIRTARYHENHAASADIKAGKLRSGHHGAQARYARADDPVASSKGHDEQQVSRDLAKDSR